MTSVLKKDRNPKSKEESLRELQRQYDEAVDRNDTKQINFLKVIFERLGEQPRVSSLSKALKQHTKKSNR